MKKAIQEHKNSDAVDVSPGTIGDLIKAEMDKPVVTKVYVLIG